MNDFRIFKKLITLIWVASVLWGFCLICACTTKAPEPIHCYVCNDDCFSSIKRVVVLGGRLSNGESATGICLLKSFPDEFNRLERFEAIPYHEVLMKVQYPFIELDLPFPKWHESINKSFTENITNKLDVDGILVVWSVKEKKYSNDFHIMAQLFDANTGKAVASVETCKELRDKFIEKNKEFICTQLTTVSYSKTDNLSTRSQQVNNGMVSKTYSSGTSSSSFNRSDRLHLRINQVLGAMTSGQTNDTIE